MIQEMCPVWFQGINILFHFVFFLVTASIAYTGYQAYKFFADEQHKFLSTGYALLALSYIVSAIGGLCLALQWDKIFVLVTGYVHHFIFIAGLMVLLFAYLKIKDALVRLVLLLLVFGIVGIVGMISATQQNMVMSIIAATLMLFIIGQLVQSHRRTCKTSTRFVTLGFSALAIGQLIMIFAHMSQTMFVLSSTITLLGFLLIAAGKMMVR